MSVKPGGSKIIPNRVHLVRIGDNYLNDRYVIGIRYIFN